MATIFRQKTNYCVVSNGMEGRLVLLDRNRPQDFLECFANMAMFLQNRLRDEEQIPAAVYDVMDGFGFTAFDRDRHWECYRDEDDEVFFLINYFTMNRLLRREDDKAIIIGNRRGNPAYKHIWTQHAHRMLLDCVIGCFADYFTRGRHFSGYYDWHNKICDVVAKYSFELDWYKYMLRVSGEDRIQDLKDAYNLRIYYEVERK